MKGSRLLWWCGEYVDLPRFVGKCILAEMSESLIHSCMNCMFSFCSKCLSKKVMIPNKGTKAQPVCRQCYKLLTNPPDPKTQNYENQGRHSPPENFKRLMESIAAKESQSRQPQHSHSNNSRQPHKKDDMARGLAPKDKELVERLNKLKEGRKKEQGPIPSTQEMEERLRALKGLPSATDKPGTSSGNTNKYYFPPDNRNLEEQFSDLIDEMSAEVKLEGSSEVNEDDNSQKGMSNSNSDPHKSDNNLEDDINRLMKESEEELKRAKQMNEADAEMAARLATLQGLDPDAAKLNFKSKHISHEGSSDEDEEMATKRLLQRLAEEEKLNDKLKESGNEGLLGKTDLSVRPKEVSYSIDPEELPWCCICNEDATLRCHGCEGDLYCKRCYKEGHDDFDHDHTTEKYRAPRNK